ncbi:hypothetical protein [Streptacidiphilus melanogenes]|uniref:hypothetical protein n=1 Tax=Streptacidiphilus melanogenes TaxID=411235 RepID=UPI0005A9EC93|nr:hypothetical protein [Streptacidiphilus melanogenes]
MRTPPGSTRVTASLVAGAALAFGGVGSAAAHAHRAASTPPAGCARGSAYGSWRNEPGHYWEKASACLTARDGKRVLRFGAECEYKPVNGLSILAPWERADCDVDASYELVHDGRTVADGFKIFTSERGVGELLVPYECQGHGTYTLTATLAAWDKADGTAEEKDLQVTAVGC